MGFKGKDHGKFKTANISPILALCTATLFLVALSCTNGLASANPINFRHFLMEDNDGEDVRVTIYPKRADHAKRQEQKIDDVLRTLQGITAYYDKVARPR